MALGGTFSVWHLTAAPPARACRVATAKRPNASRQLGRGTHGRVALGGEVEAATTPGKSGMMIIGSGIRVVDAGKATLGMMLRSGFREQAAGGKRARMSVKMKLAGGRGTKKAKIR